MIKKLSWDSDFFGYPVGKILIDKKNKFDSVIPKKKYKLIYVFSKEELAIKDSLVDKKVILHKKITNTQVQVACFEYNSKKHSYKELLELTYLSGKFSRFNTDINFTNSEFKQLYKLWIDKSVEKKNAFSVIVKLVNNTIAGFMTLQEQDKSTSSIGLIAVAALYQGKNIASELIKQGEFIAAKKGYTKIQVATQLDNIPAMNLYKKNSFNIKEINYIYHLWN